MQPIQVFLVDDSAPFLASLRDFLAVQPGVQVVGAASSGPEGIEGTLGLRPDLVLLDLAMPGMNGIEVLRRLKALPRPPRVAILTLENEPELRLGALNLGADGFIPKGELGQSLPALLAVLFPGRLDSEGTVGLSPSLPRDQKPGENARRAVHVYAESIFDTSREALLLLDDKFLVEAANRAYYETFQVLPVDTEGLSFFSLGHGQWDLPGLRALLEEVIFRDEIVSGFEVENDFEHIGKKTLVLNARRLTSTGARPGLCLAIEDLTTRRQAQDLSRRIQEELQEELEERVRQRTAALEAANRELEAFSYSISHDLRSPLRALDGYTRILLEDHAPSLPPEVREYLSDISRNSQKMGQLIDDLLSFSRLSRQELQKRSVNMAQLARQALEDLRPEQEGRQVEILLGELPSCHGDPALLKQVWMNLLGNALKYTRSREQGRIEVGSLVREGETCWFVRDNGVGFDMKYAGKLFGVFQRLHKAGEFEGTGVGLAVVQRILHRHGGRIWAQAALDQGAVFTFTVEPGPGLPSNKE